MASIPVHKLHAGYLVLNDFASPEELTALKQRAEAIVQDFDPSTVSIFSTRKQVAVCDMVVCGAGRDM